MMRSLYAGVTGLRSHQTRMDVIGNNIANVNTAGYKASRVVFQDLFSQTLSTGSAPIPGALGGVNPKQVGLGVTVGTIDVLHTRSATQYTGATLDFAIEGDGFFILDDGIMQRYTRAGNMALDRDSYLVDANGMHVQGFLLDGGGNKVFHPITGEPLLANIHIDPAYYNVTVTEGGQIIGIDPAGNQTLIGQVALARFPNQSGLQKSGMNSYIPSSNSGQAQVVQAGTNGSGRLRSGALEMSNVDLANEFSDMIVTQRGFQANSRIITTSDQMLEEVVNLKR